MSHHETEIRFLVDDEADDEEKGPQIAVRVETNNYGVELVVKNAHGHEIGRVGLDYHANTLKALVYEGDADDPTHVLTLTDIVSEEMDVHPPKFEDEQPPPLKEEPKPRTCRWGRSHGMKTWHVVLDEPRRQHPKAKEGVEKNLYACHTACDRKEIIWSQGTDMELSERPAFSPGESSVCPDCVRWVDNQIKEALSK